MNTSKSFVRACFWPGKDLVISGSEDASVCLDGNDCVFTNKTALAATDLSIDPPGLPLSTSW